MARIPEAELERVKREIDLAALVRSKGIDLKPHGEGHLAGRCPFHEDKTPSFIVTPGKNLFHCLGCGAGGSVIDFVMKHEGLSFRHAVEILLHGPTAALVKSTAPTKKTSVPRLPPPVGFDADDQTLLGQVVDYYHERLLSSPAALGYLHKRGIGTEEAVRHFRLGFADRTLGLRLPQKNRVAGASIRERLTKLGVYRESGHEHFNGCVVFPILGKGGAIEGLYGRKIEKQAAGLANHLYLPGAHRSVWNAGCLEPEALRASGGSLILCEAIIDAMTFWCAGLRHSTAAYGVEGFTEEMEQAIALAKATRVFIAYDRDQAGERGAEKAAERLQRRGIECLRVLFPHNQDANEYALKVTPASKSLPLLLNAAVWLGGKACGAAASSDARAGAPSSLAAVAAKAATADASATAARQEKGPGPEALAAKEGKASVPSVAAVRQGDAGGIPGPGSSTLALQVRGEYGLLEIEGREYRVGGLEKAAEALRVTLRLKVGERFHLDQVDLARDGERRRFIERAAEETGLHPDLLKKDLGRVLLAVEQAAAELSRPVEPMPAGIVLTEEERTAALAWLKAPDLIGRLREAFGQSGIVGEATNALVAYLACVSRKLERPLAVIVQSGSAAGKTTLMDAVLAFFPSEERIKYSAMTGQSLYYLGETNLRHKILAVVEEAGAEKASYALKLLQSEGELTIASTGKDPHSGKMVTHEYRVEGPVTIFLTTTAIDLDEELQNRCLTLAVDESAEQTARIHTLQREKRTLAGLVAREERRALLALLCNAQRLLEPLAVVNNHAPQLTFSAERTRARRDHEKYLTLIDAIALLHQHQRPRKTEEVGGRVVDYIEASAEDVALANELAAAVLSRSLDELPPQTRALLGHIRLLVASKKGAGFTRRELREACGWSLTQVTVHLERLVALEYLSLRSGRMGSLFVYDLLLAEEREYAANLTAPRGHLTGGAGAAPLGIKCA